MECKSCGAQINDTAETCSYCGTAMPKPVQAQQWASPPPNAGSAASAYDPAVKTGPNRIAVGICGILFGALGVHKFLLGYTKAGFIMLLLSVVSLGILAWVMAPIGLIEGIIYLTKSDEEFVRIYVKNKRTWF